MSYSLSMPSASPIHVTHVPVNAFMRSANRRLAPCTFSEDHEAVRSKGQEVISHGV